jgi:integrase/recombinase XerC
MKEHQINPIQHNLQHSFDATINTSFDISVTPDVLQQLLEDKRSPNTRAAYEKDLRDFFKQTTGKLPTPDLVLEFLHLERGQAVSVVSKYKAALFERGLSEARRALLPNFSQLQNKTR